MTPSPIIKGSDKSSAYKPARTEDDDDQVRNN